MPAPDMHEYLRQLVGQTVMTVARKKPNTIVDVTARRVLVETQTGHRNFASIPRLQALADGVFAGEIVEVPRHERSAFNIAVLATLPGVAYAVKPRRVWLEGFAALDAEFVELFPDDVPQHATEGRVMYRTHRLRERSAALCHAKKADVLMRTGRLACEACDLDYGERYGDLGSGFIEVHHRAPLSDEGERETTLDDLAVVCASCHRMLHRSLGALTVEELRRRLTRGA
jgi:hypothetical protein